MMNHVGRLIDHVHIVVSDLERSREFYSIALGAIGRTLNAQGRDFFGSDELFVSQIDQNSKLSHIHLAFQVPDKQSVERFYEAALSAGGKDNGVPGERNYHPGFYAAFVLDPDGNNIEAVFHGPSERSAESVVITAK